MNKLFLGIMCGLTCSLQALPSALYRRLDTTSLQEMLAFYELFPESEEGKAMLYKASEQLGGNEELLVACLAPYINSFHSEPLSEEALRVIDRLAEKASLPNRKLKGYCALSEAEVLELPSEEIDLGRALLLSQLHDKEDILIQVEQYTALLDLMALQVLANLPQEATAHDKIKALNHLIFVQMHFRFPPHSVYAKDIDLYTFLPSVMDNHLGVCLGVTTLYLALAQRVALPLEILTPPGHIYLSYVEGDQVRNIETTARGIHLPTEAYLNVNTMHVPKRNLKEVVGMTHINQASIHLHKGEFLLACQAYERAEKYLPDDGMSKELLGFCLILTGEKERGEILLREVSHTKSRGMIAPSSLPADYLDGKVDEEGITAVFIGVDENRTSIEAKQVELKKILEKYPDFREGIHQMAVAYLQLQRSREALGYLERYHALDPHHPAIEYYLAALHGEREDYANCWKHLHLAESLTKAHNFYPKALRELRRELIIHCPE